MIPLALLFIVKKYVSIDGAIKNGKSITEQLQYSRKVEQQMSLEVKNTIYLI